MRRRLFLFFCLLALSLSLFAEGTACLNSSLADLWSLAGGSVDISVQDAIDRGFASPGCILVDNASGRNIDTERLVAASPDLVLGSVDTASHVRLSSLMDSIGVEMILVKEDSFSDFLSVYRQLTGITGRDDLWLEHGIGQKAAIEETIARCQERE